MERDIQTPVISELSSSADEKLDPLAEYKILLGSIPEGETMVVPIEEVQFNRYAYRVRAAARQMGVRAEVYYVGNQTYVSRLPRIKKTLVSRENQTQLIELETVTENGKIKPNPLDTSQVSTANQEQTSVVSTVKIYNDSLWQ